MPAPYRKKDSILEMSDREREARRLAELAQPGRDAIENMYFETTAFPAGRSALKVLRNILSPNKKPLPKVDIPKEGKPLRPMRQEDGGIFKVKDIDTKTPISTRNRQEILLEKLRRREHEKSNEDMSDALSEVMSRAGVAAGFTQEQPKEYKKGGVVKAKKHRGDGIAQRGKTRGRVI